MRERLVEEQRERVREQCARDRSSLAFAAGELIGPPVEMPLDIERGGRFTNARALAIGTAQRKAKILSHAHRREERVVLRDERDPALLRRFPANDSPSR